ncbi:MAG: hypothetical protein RL685_4628 [Pseudomonadota bacterium]|jgi:hypothetical protein
MNAYKWCIPLCLAAAACGGGQLNQNKATNVQAAVMAAEQVGAKDQPKASLHLQLAREQVEEARKRAADGDESSANLLLERAQVDAELALQLARTEQEQQNAQKAWEKIREIKQESAR